MAETKKTPKLPTLTTPKGPCSFPYVHRADTEGQYANGKYKITIGLDKGDDAVEALIKKIHDAHILARGKKKTDLPYKDGDEVYDEVDDDKKEKHEWKRGKYILSFSSQYQPQIIDRAGDALADGVEVRGGDVVRVAFAMRPYEAGKNAGVSLTLRAVKLIEKRNKAGADYSDAFGDEDDEDQTDGDNNDNASDDDSGGDF